MANSLDPNIFLGKIPEALALELLEAYNSIVKNYQERRWETAELSGGKLSEIVYTILKGHIDGSFPTTAAKPNRFDQACRDLEQASGYPRSVRVTIPRTLIALYEIRNNRSVGHVGGDVDPNEMDSALVIAMSKWVVTELIRIFHSTDIEKASSLIETLTERTSQYIWNVNGVKRVLVPDLKLSEKILFLLHSTPTKVPEAEMANWIEVTRMDHFRHTLRDMHSKRLVEFNEVEHTIALSPLGIQAAEKLNLSD